MKFEILTDAMAEKKLLKIYWFLIMQWLMNLSCNLKSKLKLSIFYVLTKIFENFFMFPINLLLTFLEISIEFNLLYFIIINSNLNEK